MGDSLFLTNLSKNFINSALKPIYFILFSRTGLQKYNKHFKSQENFKIFFELFQCFVAFNSRTGCKSKKIFNSFSYLQDIFSDYFENMPENTVMTDKILFSEAIMRHHHNLKNDNPYPKRGHKSSSSYRLQRLQPMQLALNPADESW